MDLEDKIKTKSAEIGIIGLGYVGLPLAMEFSRASFHTLGFDLDQEKVSTLKNGRSYIGHIPVLEVKKIVNKSFYPTTDFSLLKKCDCIIICVPTPVTEAKDPDMSFIARTAETIQKNIRKEQLIVLESTTYPGTTRNVVKLILEKSGLKSGEDFYLAYSPEREDPGNKNFSTRTIAKVVGGLDKTATKLAALLYRQVIEKVVTVSSAEIAESTKMLENTFRAVNIALVNELKMLYDRMGLDIYEVIEASKTKPFGFMPFYPGPGWGGHCIPVDPFYLSWMAKKYDFTTRFIELAGEINNRMPEFVFEKTQQALNKNKKTVNGAKILILGLAYKKDIADPRESPAFKIIELFEKNGGHVNYNDPFIPQTPAMRNFKMNKKSVALTPQNLKKYDCLVVVTDHSCYDYPMIKKYASLIVDTRNVFKTTDKKIVKA